MDVKRWSNKVETDSVMRNSYTKPTLIVITLASKNTLMTGSLVMVNANAEEEGGEYVDPLGREEKFFFDIEDDLSSFEE